MRIVSLLPSATEMLCEIGLEASLCGVSHECDYPSSILQLPKVTQSRIPPSATSDEIDRIISKQAAQSPALFSLQMDALVELRPDVIVTQTLCDVCAVAEGDVIAALQKLPKVAQVINLSPMTLTDVLQQMQMLGRKLQCGATAKRAVERLEHRIASVVTRSRLLDKSPKVALLEWLDPLFSAGHWNPELVRLAGGRECLGVEGGKSRRIDWQDLVDADPDAMIIACCGFDTQRAMIDVPVLQSQHGYESLRCVRDRQVYVVDGSAYFNRPGPRLVDSLEILSDLFQLRKSDSNDELVAHQRLKADDFSSASHVNSLQVIRL